MQTKTSRLAAVGLATTLSLFAAACGGDDDETTATPATEAPAAQPAPSTGATGNAQTASSPTGPACASVPTSGEGSFTGMADDPAATAASNNPALSTLVSAVKEAGLVDTLNGPGPFTIFAPVNDAFAKVPSADLNALLADKEALTEVLTTHVVAGKKLSAADLMGMRSVETVAGNTITLSSTGGALRVNDQATVACANVPTANATVHLIDGVLMAKAMGGTQTAMAPTGPACASVPTSGEGSFTGMADDPAATAASNNPALSTLVSAVQAAGLVDTLNGPGPFTIFAPVNDAFAKIPSADLNALLADKAALTEVLTTHVVAGKKLSAADLTKMQSVETVAGKMLTLSAQGGALRVNGQATVGCADVPTANATVHLIDGVLMAS